MCYTLYPNLGGIFFDEGWPECRVNNQYVDLYKYINDCTKRAYSSDSIWIEREQTIYSKTGLDILRRKRSFPGKAE